MNKNKKHINLLVSRWLHGETGWREETRLDHLAREDEFLAEAMEGYRKFPASDHAGNLDRLRVRLRQGKRRPLVFVYRTAAAIAVLVVAGGIFWMFNRQETGLDGFAQTKIMAEPVEEQTETAPAPAEPEGVAAEEDQAGTQYSAPSLPATTRQPPPEKSGELADESIHHEPEDLAARSEAGGQETIEALQKMEVKPDADIARAGDKTLEREAAPKPSAAKEKAPAGPPPGIERPAQLNSFNTASSQPGRGQRLIQGTISDGEGYPLIGASVFIKNSGKGTVTGIDGRFSILADTSDQRLSVSYTGFTTREFPISGQNAVNLVLEPSGVALNEVVVTGLGAKKNKKDAGGAKAEPRGGYARLNRYLRKNLRLPDDFKADTLSGRVILKFLVEPNGKLDRFQVIESLCPACDQEAIRVLREGPPWEVLGEQKPVEVILTAPFRRE